MCEAFIYLIYIWMPHTRIRHVICDVTYTYVYEALIYVTRFIHVWLDSFMYATWLIHDICMTHSCVWHEAFIYMTGLIGMYTDVLDQLLKHVQVVHVTSHIRIRDMTHSCVWHDALIYVTCLLDKYGMTHSCVWHEAFISMTCDIRMYTDVLD